MIEISKSIQDISDIHNIVLDYYKENNINLKTPFKIGITIEADLKDCYVIKVMPLDYKGFSFVLSSI